MSKTIGIIGGMGPAATVELFRRIVALTPARRDQDHLRIIIDNNPRIPDRTAAILGKRESPLPLLIETARTLERAGAELLAMPCNTAHFYLSQLQAAIRVPVVDMIEETVRAVRESRIGLLATDGTVKAEVYQRACAAHGVELVLPPPRDQRWLMEAIYGIKSGATPARFENGMEDIIGRLRARGIQGVIIGCTELSLITIERSSIAVYDALDVLARRVVEVSRGRGGYDAGNTRP